MRNQILLFGIAVFITAATGCIKDRVFPIAVYNTPGTASIGSRTPVHYWNFNSNNLLIPTYTIGGGNLFYTAGGAADAISTGSALNARNGDAAGAGLRLRNPAGTFILNLPTSNYKDFIFSFATQRSNNGAQQNIISYSIDGTNFITDSLKPNIHQLDTTWQSFFYDFTGIKRANDNPNFKIRIAFAVSDTGTSGNDRYDNISLDGNIINPLPPPIPVIIHYWNFNSSYALLNATNTIGGAALNYSAVYDSYTPGSVVNARNGDLAGDAIRLRNTSGTVFTYGTLNITSPTTNYKNIKLTMEVQSSGNGPQTNTLTYTLDGTNYMSTGISTNSYTPGIGTAYNLVTFDFTGITGINNNPNFKVKIDFSNGSTSTAGNDRFDNIVFEGVHQ